MNPYFDKQIPHMLSLGLSEKAIPQLKLFIELLWTKNEELNLISRKMTFEDLIDNHVIDSLLPLKYFPTTVKTVADFGTGGGLPAIIYAIQFPEIKFRLYEKSALKQEFLNSCKTILKNISVHGDIPPILQDVNLVIARGFKPIDVILDISRAYYLQKGKYFLLKARLEKIDEEKSLAIKKFKSLTDPSVVKVECLSSPVLNVERHLVLIN